MPDWRPALPGLRPSSPRSSPRRSAPQTPDPAAGSTPLLGFRPPCVFCGDSCLHHSAFLVRHSIFLPAPRPELPPRRLATAAPWVPPALRLLRPFVIRHSSFVIRHSPPGQRPLTLSNPPPPLRAHRAQLQPAPAFVIHHSAFVIRPLSPSPSLPVSPSPHHQTLTRRGRGSRREGSRGSG